MSIFLSLSRVELIQTELHHIQTLTVMSEVFRRGMVEELQLDWDCVARIFPCLDSLLLFHRNLFGALQERRQAGTQPDNPQNYFINQIGDVLLQQVGGRHIFTRKHTQTSMTEGLFLSFQMKMQRKWRRCMESSAAITPRLWMSSKNCCSKIKNFKTLSKWAAPPKLILFLHFSFAPKYMTDWSVCPQQQSNNSLVRRRGVPEFILLITQRITKYPVLLERMLQYTQGTSPLVCREHNCKS